MGQSQATVLLRTPPVTQMIFFNQGMLLLGSTHFPTNHFLKMDGEWKWKYLSLTKILLN